MSGPLPGEKSMRLSRFVWFWRRLGFKALEVEVEVSRGSASPAAILPFWLHWGAEPSAFPFVFGACMEAVLATGHGHTHTGFVYGYRHNAAVYAFDKISFVALAGTINA